MTNILKYAGVVALLAVVVIAFRVYPINFGSQKLGAAGGLYAENYQPYLLYNGGYNSQLPIQTSALVTFTGGEAFTGGMTVGASGTALNQVNAGFCNVWAAAATIAATSTVTVDCGGGANGQTALTGITAGAGAEVQFGTTSPTTSGGLVVESSSASSTPGFLTLHISNFTGTTFTWTATASTSLTYEVFK